MYMKEMFYKEWAYIITEAEKSPDLQFEGPRSNVVFQSKCKGLIQLYILSIVILIP